jgi:hypothetical protein
MQLTVALLARTRHLQTPSALLRLRSTKGLNVLAPSHDGNGPPAGKPGQATPRAPSLDAGQVRRSSPECHKATRRGPVRHRARTIWPWVTQGHIRGALGRVTRHDFVAELRVPATGPIADYVRSMSGTSHHADPDRVVATVVDTFPKSPDGHYVITSHSGCLICEND